MPRKSRRAVALVSGVDSEVLVLDLLRLGWEVHPLYVRCGFRWERTELARLRRALAALRRPGLAPLEVVEAPMGPFLRGHWSLGGRRVPGARSPDAAVYLPGRNMILLTLAWLHAAARGAERVALGTLKSNPFPDATPRFRVAAERALNLALGTRVRVWTPYASLRKRDVLSRARGFPLGLAFSCLAPTRGRPCGRCNKCAELSGALAAVRAGARTSRPASRRLRASGSRPRRPAARRATGSAGA